ncbi:4Fe-4S dicluster domain-containing protein [Oricola sp.]|uniref:4Fe-4S dicluster domain-containing protein n=1 Tax=Oricola sp. TaxID=1979950 RepID=UPI003BA85ACF
MPASAGAAYVIQQPTELVDALLAQGWRVVGPRERNGAIVYEEIANGSELPRGRTDEQGPARYRLTDGDPDRWFDYVVGPQSWKKWLFPARQKLWSASRADDGFAVEEPEEVYPKTAFIGVRACEIAAIQVQDKVFDNGDFADTGYGMRRENTMIVAVQCARSADTCFCASMNTGPRAESGFDLALTELDGEFLLECGTAKGADVLAAVTMADAQPGHVEAASRVTAQAAESQSRKIAPGIASLLADNLEHPRWDDVADRCMSCANCTLACPTCFCTDVEDTNDLQGDNTERWRTWDSCFTLDFSYIHGGAVRRSTRSRYRQWMTHKLSSWHDQFGTSGCVGCGRCIAWCPVGIDITEEAAAIAAAPAEQEA